MSLIVWSTFLPPPSLPSMPLDQVSLEKKRETVMRMRKLLKIARQREYMKPNDVDAVHYVLSDLMFKFGFKFGKLDSYANEEVLTEFENLKNEIAKTMDEKDELFSVCEPGEDTGIKAQQINDEIDLEMLSNEAGHASNCTLPQEEAQCSDRQIPK